MADNNKGATKIQDFSWDSPSNDTTKFFGQNIGEPDIHEEQEVEIPKVTTTKVEGQTKKEEKPEVTEDDFFNNEEDETTGGENNEEEDDQEGIKENKKKNQQATKTDTSLNKDKKDDNKQKEEEKEDVLDNEEEDSSHLTPEILNGLIEDLKEEGILSNFKLEEGEELTTDSILKGVENEVDTRVDETITGLFDGLDDRGAKYLNFLRKGGTTEEFFRVHSQIVDIPQYSNEGSNEEKKESAKRVLQFYYRNVEGLSKEDADDTINILDEAGKLEKQAEKYTKIIKDKDDARKQKLLQEQELKHQRFLEEQAEFTEVVANRLKELDNVGELSITKEDKKVLINKIFKPTVKIGENRYISETQFKLNKVLSDRKNVDKLIALAKVLDLDFNFKDILKKGETQVTRKIKSNLANAVDKSKARPSTSSSGRNNRDLADFFNE
jgi:hypothetical protein